MPFSPWAGLDPTSRCAGHRGWPGRVRDNLFKPHSPTPLPRAGSGLRNTRKIRRGEGLIWEALLPRAALARLACPGLLSHALSGLKARSLCGFRLPPVSSEKDMGHDQALGRGEPMLAICSCLTPARRKSVTIICNRHLCFRTDSSGKQCVWPKSLTQVRKPFSRL